MKTKTLELATVAVFAGLTFVITGCNRQTRSNPADDRYRAATPAEGGATSTKGSAGERKNFGDTRTKTEVEGQSPSASPTGLSKDVTPAQQTQTPAAGPSTGAAPGTTK